jgi:hypothetical protein
LVLASIAGYHSPSPNDRHGLWVRSSLISANAMAKKRR